MFWKLQIAFCIILFNYVENMLSHRSDEVKPHPNIPDEQLEEIAARSLKQSVTHQAKIEHIIMSQETLRLEIVKGTDNESLRTMGVFFLVLFPGSLMSICRVEFVRTFLKKHPYAIKRCMRLR